MARPFDDDDVDIASEAYLDAMREAGAFLWALTDEEWTLLRDSPRCANPDCGHLLVLGDYALSGRCLIATCPCTSHY